MDERPKCPKCCSEVFVVSRGTSRWACEVCGISFGVFIEDDENPHVSSRTKSPATAGGEPSAQDSPYAIVALKKLLLGGFAGVVVMGGGLFVAHLAGWINLARHDTVPGANHGQGLSDQESQPDNIPDPAVDPPEKLPDWAEALIRLNASEVDTDLRLGKRAWIKVEFSGAEFYTYKAADGTPAREVRVQVRATLTSTWNVILPESVRSGIGRKGEERALRIDRDYGLDVRAADGSLIPASMLGSLGLGKNPAVGATATAELRVPADADVRVIYLGTPVQQVRWIFKDGQWAVVGT